MKAVIAATQGQSASWSGEESDYWAGWEQDFAALSQHEDPDIRRIGAYGQRAAEEERSRALIRERHEAVYGI